jgi:hypothetical protein
MSRINKYISALIKKTLEKIKKKLTSLKVNGILKINLTI